MKVVVTGAAGQLGRTMVIRLSGRHQVVAATRAEVDFTNDRQLFDFVMRHQPQAIVNCAAFTNVDLAEEQPQVAMAVNAFAVRMLSRAAAELDAVLVHYSTDFVFSGASQSPYTETDPPEPQGVYAQSKLIGEWMAADCSKHYIARVESLFGGPQARSSVDKIVNAVRAGQQAPVFVDRVVSPSYVEDVAGATMHLLENGAGYGVYHCVNTGHATWFEVGREIARLAGGDESLLKPVSVHEVKLRARRPQYAALSNAKLAGAGYPMPTWQEALGRYVETRP